MINNNQRSVYIDIVKAFAIICVVFGHSIQFGSGSEYLQKGIYFENILFKVIYSFHMPLFMLISGYLFAFSINKRKWSELIVYKIKTLIVPILLWSIISCALILLKMYLNEQPISLLIAVKEYIAISLENFWFLWAIFWCSFVVTIVHKFFGDNVIIYVLGLVLTFIIPDILNLSLYKFMYPFFLMGYFFNSKNYVKKYKNIIESKQTLALCGIVFIGLLYLYDYDSYIYTSGYCILKDDLLKQLFINVYRFSVGITGSSFVMLIIKKAYKYIGTKANHIILYVGQNSIGIYIISSFVFSYALTIITFNLSSINYFITIIETATILFFCLLCTFIIQKSSYMNKLLLGGR